MGKNPLNDISIRTRHITEVSKFFFSLKMERDYNGKRNEAYMDRFDLLVASPCDVLL